MIPFNDDRHIYKKIYNLCVKLWNIYDKWCTKHPVILSIITAVLITLLTYEMYTDPRDTPYFIRLINTLLIIIFDIFAYYILYLNIRDYFKRGK